jgi:hypothetical protein
MAQIKEAIFTHLSTDAGVSALVGTKIYPSFSPTNAVQPYIVFERTSLDSTENLVDTSDIENEDFSFFIFGQTVLEVENIIKALTPAMELLKNGLTVSGIKFSRCFKSSTSDSFTPKGLGDEVPNYSSIVSYTCWFRDA